MKNSKLIIYSLLITLSSTSSLVLADPLTAQQGLEKIKANLENSKANQIEYEKNLQIVNKNVAEVSKAKTIVAKQKETVNAEILQNNESLKKVLVQERDLTTLITQEKEKLAQETKQLEQLDKMLQQVKQNQIQREANITEYQNQLKMSSEEKKAWKDRETELRAQEAKTIQNLRGLASEESNWGNKKKGYEGEAKRWSAESEKQARIQDTYQGLATEK
jgi:chromosome segregation ATPase